MPCVTLLALAHVVVFRKRLVASCRKATAEARLRVAWIVLSWGLFYTHYTSILLLAAELLYLVVSPYRRRVDGAPSRGRWLIDLVCIAAGCSLALPQLLLIGQRRDNWSQFVKPQGWTLLWTIFAGESIPRGPPRAGPAAAGLESRRERGPSDASPAFVLALAGLLVRRARWHRLAAHAVRLGAAPVSALHLGGRRSLVDARRSLGNRAGPAGGATGLRGGDVIVGERLLVQPAPRDLDDPQSRRLASGGGGGYRGSGRRLRGPCCCEPG